MIAGADVSGDPEGPPLPLSQLIDLTTTGRRTGRARRIEIVLHNFEGRLYISGMPNPARARAWLLNLASDPRLTIHLKGSVVADLTGSARVIADESERRAVFASVVKVWRGQEIETMNRHSPLIEVTLADRG
ncbi:MAG: nitroreductase/quinone reductase family protein [Candidatus Limnocylindrales bacterium]|nr:nitroreductase/quinone reductase family protein [Candidatus Limnocylindrales bacterium]